MPPPVRHGLRRIASSYDRGTAIAEAREFLAGRPYTRAGDAQRTLGGAPRLAMKVLVLAEYYPREHDPVLGIWAHRQALAARDAGAELRVLVLYRPLPPLQALRDLDLGAARRVLAQARAVQLDGLQIDYLRFLSPPRPWSYGRWGAWAAPVLTRWLAQVRAEFSFDLIHAHYAVPAGDAARRAAPGTPLVVSVHGGDVLGAHAGGRAVRDTLGHARLVLANSAGTAERCATLGAPAVRVVHLGADLPGRTPVRPSRPTLVSVGNLIERKRHADVNRRPAGAARASSRASLRDRRRRSRARAPAWSSPSDSAWRTRSSSVAGSVTSRRWRWRSRRHAVCASQRRRGVRRQLRGGDGRRSAGGRVPGRGRSRGDRRGRRRDRACGPRATPPVWRTRSMRCSPTRRGCRRWAARPGRTVQRSFTWEQCGRRDRHGVSGRSGLTRGSRPRRPAPIAPPE